MHEPGGSWGRSAKGYTERDVPMTSGCPAVPIPKSRQLENDADCKT